MTGNGNGNGRQKVFLSYSRKDDTVCKRLYKDLAQQDLDVRVDFRDLPKLDSVEGGLADLIRQCSATVCIVSRNSLQSPWVIWELMRSFDDAGGSRHQLIPVSLDQAYLDDRLFDHVQAAVQGEIEAIVKRTAELSRLGAGTDHLDSRRRRLLEMKADLSRIVDLCRSVNIVSLEPAAYAEGVEVVYRRITGKPSLAIPVTARVFDSIDLKLRVEQVQAQVVDGEIKEAAKRLLDFVNEFCPKSIEYRLRAVHISAGVNLADKLPKGKKRIDMILDHASKIMDLLYEVMRLAGEDSEVTWASTKQPAN